MLKIEILKFENVEIWNFEIWNFAPPPIHEPIKFEIPNSELRITKIRKLYQKFQFPKTRNLKFESFAQKIENWFLEDHILRVAYTYNIAQITMFLWIFLRIRCVRIRKKL